MRHIDNAKPLIGPYFLRACNAYSEHVGVKRHDGGVIGDMQCLYIIIGMESNSTNIFDTHFHIFPTLFIGFLYEIFSTILFKRVIIECSTVANSCSSSDIQIKANAHALDSFPCKAS